MFQTSHLLAFKHLQQTATCVHDLNYMKDVKLVYLAVTSMATRDI